MIKFGADIDTRGLKLKIPREEKRLAFNTALALNETAKAVQVEERANLDRKFTVRKNTFMYRLIKIFTFASARQGRPYAEVGIDRKDRVLLSRFEKGGERPPFKGERVAVPVTEGPARPTFAQSVVDAFRFTRLGLRPRSRRFHPSALAREHGPQRIGRPGSGIFQTAKGIFRRVADDIEKVYLFIRRPKLDQRLDFVSIARRVIAREWPVQFKKAYRK